MLDPNCNEGYEKKIIRKIEDDNDQKQRVLIEILQSRIIDDAFYKTFLRKFKIAYNLGDFSKYRLPYNNGDCKEYKDIYVGIYEDKDYNLVIFIEKEKISYYFNNNHIQYGSGTYEIGNKIIINYSFVEDYKGKNKQNENWYSGNKKAQIKVLNNQGFQEFEKNSEQAWEYIEDNETKKKRVLDTSFSNCLSNFIEEEYIWRQYGFLLKKLSKKYENFVPKNDFINDGSYCIIGLDLEPNSKLISSCGRFASFDGEIKDYINDEKKLIQLYNGSAVQERIKKIGRRPNLF